MSSALLNVVSVEDEQPVSRTYQYRKVMKPMLERKRRARINRCLDELKELMSAALASEGENLTKLEKADVLELTVRHLHKLRERQALGLSNNHQSSGVDKFRAGFSHCAAEVSRYLSASTGLDVGVGQNLMSHLGRCVHHISANDSAMAASSIPAQFNPAPIYAAGASSYTPPTSPTLSSSSLSSSTMMQHRHLHSPALSESDASSVGGPCDYSSVSSSTSLNHVKYSIRSDLYSPLINGDHGKVWRPW